MFKSGENAKLIKVTLDNGKIIRCTPEHRFMLSNGDYKEAVSLVSGDSLMSLYTKNESGGPKNYKIISVEFLDYTEDVYDIEVADNHNFALEAGIFVHNSKDSADGICGAIYNASQNAALFAFEFGEDIENITNINSAITNPEAQKKQIILDYEAELKRAFDSMSTYAENKSKADEDYFINFGWGKATSKYNAKYLSHGIVLN